MRKKISLVILSNSGASAKQFTISAVFLRVFFVGCLMAATALGYDYYRLKISAVTALDNTLQLSNQTDEVMRQREQIQEFAEEISSKVDTSLTLEPSCFSTASLIKDVDTPSIGSSPAGYISVRKRISAFAKDRPNSSHRS